MKKLKNSPLFIILIAVCASLLLIIPVLAGEAPPDQPAVPGKVYLPLVQSLALPTPPPVSNADWAMLAGNPQRTSWSTAEVRGDLDVEWFVTINAKMVREPQIIAADNKVFLATNKGVFAFNAATGATLWVYGTEMPLGHAPTYANGFVYAAGFDRRVHAIHATTGALKAGWTFVEAGAGFETNPLVIGSRVYLGNRDGYFYCLDANTGALVWKWRDESDENPEAPIRFSAAYKDGVIYFASDNSHAYALHDNGASASLVWKSASCRVWASPLIGRSCITIKAATRITCFSPAPKKITRTVGSPHPTGRLRITRKTTTCSMASRWLG